MCGRFENKLSITDLVQILNTLQLPADHVSKKTVNISPTEEIFSILKEEEKFQLAPLRWGIKFSKESPLIFNSRIETIKEKPFWKSLFDKNRCLVPMTGFYEWKKSGSKKIPYRLFLPDEPVFFVAALYNINKVSGKEISLITTTPNKFVSNVHHRMPVIIRPGDAERFFSQPIEENIARSLPLADSVKMEMEPAEL